MLSGRMLKIIDYLESNKESTYKEISTSLDIKERYVRYDIDRINNILEYNKMSLIEKLSKGSIIFPENINTSILTKENDFIYSQEERVSLILLILLIDNRRLKINKLSLDFQVSRSTIKNDITFLENKLSKNNIKITYTDHFFLDGLKNNRVALVNNEFEKYVYLLKGEKLTLNAFESYAVDIIENAFSAIELNDVIKWIDDLLENMNCILTDDAYKWYVSNILVVIWFILKGKENPLESTIKNQYSDIYDNFIIDLEAIIKIKISHKKQKVLIRLINYINKDVGLDGDMDLIYIETIVSHLIEAMSKEMDIDFSKDNILIDGLLNHIIPLIKRVTGRINLYDEVFSILPEKYIDVFHAVSKVIKDIDGLKNINNYDEITYLTIYFIASIKRITKTSTKNILLVCGHGYGSTAMLKESLLHEFQVNVVDTIPVYKLTTYNNWRNIDFIISTVKINVQNKKGCLIVNPVLSDKDYANIEKMGIERKKIGANYYSISEKLNFLNEIDKMRVLDIIKKEFGYENLITPSKISKLSDLLFDNCIEFYEEKMEWKVAVKESTKLLEKENFIDESYKEDIINTIESVGFYSITDNSFALLHGRGITGVYRSCISLIVSREYIEFGEKKAKVIFCLASKDKKEHIPAVVVLMRMMKNTNLINRLEKANSLNEIKEIIRKSELEVVL
ncbi:BglG family transcription antiterminator [Clostridium sp. MB05]